MKFAINCLCIVLTLTFGCYVTHGQTINKANGFCSDKKWNPVKYRETDGKIYPIDDNSKKEYVVLRCNGTFESAEDEGRTILKGSWTWNPTKKVITMNSDKKIKDYPKTIITKVQKWTATELVISKKDGGNEEVLIFFTQ